MRTILLFTTSIFSFSVFAQQGIIWESAFGGPGTDAGYDIITTSDGGYLAVGITDADGGDVTGTNGDDDFWVVKLDSVGTIEWQDAFGGSGQDRASSVKEDNQGNYVIGGFSYSNSGDVGGNYGNSDYWIVKLNPSGTMLWEQNYGGSAIDAVEELTVLNDSTYIVVGRSSSSDVDVGGNNGDSDIWLLGMDTGGTKLFEINLGGTLSEYDADVAATFDGGIIISSTTISSDIDVPANYGLEDVWVVKIDSIGQVQWSKNFGGSSGDLSRDIIQLADSNYVFVGGSVSNDIDLSTNNGSVDGWIAKIDKNGNLVWSTSVGSSGYETLEGVVEELDGNLMTIMNDGTAYVFNQFNPLGNLIANFKYGGESIEQPTNLKITKDGGFIINGYSNSISGNVSNNNGGFDFWVVELCGPLSEPPTTSIVQNGNALTATNSALFGYQWLDCTTNQLLPGDTFQTLFAPASGEYAVIIDNGCAFDTSDCQQITLVHTEEMQEGLEVKIFPNPSHGQVFINSNKLMNKVRLYTLAGKLIDEFNINSTNTTLALGMLKQGIYLVEVIQGNATSYQKLSVY